MKMKLSDIKITEAFENTHPKPDKVRKKKEQWLKTGRQEKYIVVNKDGYLVDGYITYLIMKELGIEEAKIIKKKSLMNPVESLEIKEPNYRTENTTYVWGVHPNSPDEKLYVWRVPNCESWNEFKENITVGDMIFCYAKGKVSLVIIKAVQTTDTCPTPLDVKKVCSKNIVKRGEQMPDITMCMTLNCPKKDKCYRYTASPDKFQSYADYEKYCMKNNYKYFWKNEYPKRE